MELMSIGEFARRSRLSPKALRLYDDPGVLPPARTVDRGHRLLAVFAPLAAWLYRRRTTE